MLSREEVSVTVLSNVKALYYLEKSSQHSFKQCESIMLSGEEAFLTVSTNVKASSHLEKSSQ